MSVTRPETTDGHGITHRYGCQRPGWTVEHSRVLPAWRIVRCAGCGALTLTTPAGVTR